MASPDAIRRCNLWGQVSRTIIITVVRNKKSSKTLVLETASANLSPDPVRDLFRGLD